jgi:peptidoglycan hydrolase CwlO-like protein
MGFRVRIRPLRHALVALALLAVGGVAALAASAPSTRADGLTHLQSELGAQRARQHDLSSSIGSLDGLISSLSRQITLVRGRETAVDDALDRERAQLRGVATQLVAERTRLSLLRRRLAGARSLLAAQLRSGYESSRPDLMEVVLEAHGFQDLLTKLSFLSDAQHEQQRLITFTATAKRQASAAATRLAGLKRSDTTIAHGMTVRARALAGMNALLATKEAALGRARTAQSLALASSRLTSRHLAARISSIEAARRAAALRAARAAAARAAAAAQAAAQATPTPPATPGASGGDGGWAIPYAIVLCESGGQNLPPNSAGASGYYQIIPSTWRLFGGTGPAAYLAPLAEQSAVASRIWNGGAGASNWVCAGIVGIH